MPDDARAADPFDQLDRIKALAPHLEELAAEYASGSEPLREAPNAMLAAGPDAWPDALYSSGPRLARLDMSDAAWGFSETPNPQSSDATLARYTLFRMAQAAAAGRREEVERWRGRLAARPSVSSAATAARGMFACSLMARSRHQDRFRTRERAFTALAAVGLDMSYILFDALKRAECNLTPGAEDVLRHWVDRDATPDWLDVDGRLPPLGYRRASPDCNTPKPEPTAALTSAINEFGEFVRGYKDDPLTVEDRFSLAVGTIYRVIPVFMRLRDVCVLSPEVSDTVRNDFQKQFGDMAASAFHMLREVVRDHISPSLLPTLDEELGQLERHTYGVLEAPYWEGQAAHARALIADFYRRRLPLLRPSNPYRGELGGRGNHRPTPKPLTMKHPQRRVATARGSSQKQTANGSKLW